MITALVQFALPRPLTREQARDAFAGSAARYRDVPGLIRKYYLLSADGTTAGGVYLWRSRAEAEALYTEEWAGSIAAKYGAPPSVAYFDSPVVVDNVVPETIIDD